MSDETPIKINDPLALPCGVILKNRLAKSAMSENMATKNYTPTIAFSTLYSRWANGGIGLCITGNIMVDQSALGEPANIVLDKNFQAMNELKAWANSGTENDTSLWVQLNHPGKQSPNFLSKGPVAPSAIAFAAPMDKMFNTPKELSEDEILHIIQAFAYAAKLAQEAAFSGVQIHGAHGYLLSQFLSPLHNQRSDQWGGNAENRMRFVVEVYKAIRLAVGDKFPVGIKLNSSDFQKGGFSEEESVMVLKTLDGLGIDLIEISGGTYESAAMTGKIDKSLRKSTQKREAYFIDFTQKIRTEISCPILLTGGFRSLEGIQKSLATGTFDMVGLARSMAIDPELPNKLLAGNDFEYAVIPRRVAIKGLGSLFPLEIIWYAYQLVRMGKGLNPRPNFNNYLAILWTIMHTGLAGVKRVRAK